MTEFKEIRNQWKAKKMEVATRKGEEHKQRGPAEESRTIHETSHKAQAAIVPRPQPPFVSCQSASVAGVGQYDTEILGHAVTTSRLYQRVSKNCPQKHKLVEE